MLILFHTPTILDFIEVQFMTSLNSVPRRQYITGTHNMADAVRRASIENLELRDNCQLINRRFYKRLFIGSTVFISMMGILGILLYCIKNNILVFHWNHFWQQLSLSFKQGLARWWGWPQSWHPELGSWCWVFLIESTFLIMFSMK